MGIGRQIRELREEHGLSREELASILSLQEETLGKYEQDMLTPSYGTIIEMAGYFGVSTERLFGIETGQKVDISGLSDDKKEAVRNIVGGMR